MPIRGGQVLTSDFVLSLIIFFVIFEFTFTIWNMAQSKTMHLEAERRMQEKTAFMTETLIKSQGYPANWNEDNVILIGLSDENFIIQDEKVEEFQSMDYEKIKNIFGIEDYDLNVTISTETAYYTIGRDIDDDALIIVPIRRIILLNSSGSVKRGTLNLITWAK